MKIWALCLGIGLAAAPGCRCPPPQVLPAPSPCPAVACPEPAAAQPAKCAPCSGKPKANASATQPLGGSCLFGVVRTAGELVMVVQRAKVLIRVGKDPVGELQTDSQGQFVYCFGPDRGTASREGRVEVSKPPFHPAARSFELAPGQHRALDFALEAEGLTN